MPKAPLLWPSRLTPQNEIAAVKDLYAHLTGLHFSVEAWHAGLLLYQTAINPPASIPYDVARRWKFIACHECILELYHLRSRFEKILSVKLRGCPSIRVHVDLQRIKDARKALEDAFPDTEQLRHAIAHQGENEAHSEVYAPEGTFGLTGFREPDCFSLYYRGQRRSIDLTDASLIKITAIVTDYLASFAGAAQTLEEQGHLE